MELETCVHCNTPVLVAADGSCPACRSPEPRNPAGPRKPPPMTRPVTQGDGGATLPPPMEHQASGWSRFFAFVAGGVAFAIVEYIYREQNGRPAPVWLVGGLTVAAMQIVTYVWPRRR